MKKQTNNFITVLFWLLTITQLFSLIFLSHRFDDGIRIVNYCFFGIGFLLFFYALLRNKNNLRRAVPLFMIFVASALSWILYGLDFDVIICFLGYFLMLSVWMVSDSLMDVTNINKIILASSVLQGVVLIVFSFSSRAYLSYQEYVTVSKELTLGFSNPNTTGIILFSTIAFLVISFNNIKSWWLKIFVVGEIIYLSLLLLKTDARTSIIGLIAVLVWCLFFKKIRAKNLPRLDFVPFLVLFISFVFVFVYLWMGDKNNINDVMFFGKKILSGRQRVYSEVFSIWNNYLLGNMNIFYFENAHNGLLTILVNTGVIGFSLYIYLVLRELFDINKRIYLHRYIPVSVVAFLVLIIISATESAVLVGGTIFYYFQLIVLTLCRKETRVFDHESSVC